MNKNFADLKAQVAELIALVKRAIEKIGSGSGGSDSEVTAMTAELKASSDALKAAVDGATGPTGPSDPGPTGPTGPTGPSAEERAAARRLAGAR